MDDEALIYGVWFSFLLFVSTNKV